MHFIKRLKKYSTYDTEKSQKAQYVNSLSSRTYAKSCREVERSVWVILMEKDNDKATQFMQFKKLL